MKPVGEIRRDNLLLLIKKAGSKAALNALLGRVRTDATISQYANRSPDSKTGKPKMMGGGFARQIDGKLKLGDGWMDTPHEDVSLEPAEEAPEPAEWPFAVSYARFDKLSPNQKEAIENAVAGMIQGYEAVNKEPPSGGSSFHSPEDRDRYGT